MRLISFSDPVWGDAAHEHLSCSVVLELQPATTVEVPDEPVQDSQGAVTFRGKTSLPVAAVVGDPTAFQASRDADGLAGEVFAAIVGSGQPIAEYVAPAEPVPAAVSAFQAKAALLAAGLLDEAQAAVAAAAPIVQLAWSTAQVFERSSPTIATLAAALVPPLTATQVDDLFRAAARISA
ncbi:hypothetical protein EYW49_20500 [Siculibacillus lacustris]|uniref:Uncharacterized protein n=1 Tax=Siculibacillus lacustris TaxID=1549641 RepID=A0A4Q9VF30_9HYPH|nr:hypothetical protein [Siculibacillus lacustris]TBW33342.1 hypothetical protein EYW49_20500 [Siculibacillus lacustris]